MRILKNFLSKFSTIWVCPKCGCELPYKGEGNMRCPNCGAWEQDE